MGGGKKLLAAAEKGPNAMGAFLCDNMVNCFVTAIMFGLGDGRGVKAAQVQPQVPDVPLIHWFDFDEVERDVTVMWIQRHLFDLCFFIVIIVILRSNGTSLI